MQLWLVQTLWEDITKDCNPLVEYTKYNGLYKIYNRIDK